MPLILKLVDDDSDKENNNDVNVNGDDYEGILISLWTPK